MNLHDEIIRRVNEEYRHLWMHRKTFEFALSTNAYTFVNGKRRTVEIDVSRERRSHHAKLKRFEKSWVYVATLWGEK